MSDKTNIFRKASLERVSSPEQLNDYIKVTGHSVWLVLTAVVVLLIGVLVWSVCGTLTTTPEAVAVVAKGSAICYLRPEDATGIAAGMTVHIEDSTGTVTDIAATPIEITTDFDAYALYLGGYQAGGFVIPMAVDIAVPDGVYPAKLILESVSPISFILN